MTLIVCSLALMPEVVATRRPSHMITLIDPATPVRRPLGLDRRRHLRLELDDIAEPIAGYVAPDERSVRRILEFSRGWDARRRWWSTATPASAARPPAPSSSPASATPTSTSSKSRARFAAPRRTPIPTAASSRWPTLLGRGGRMMDAVEAMGGNDFAPTGPAFDLPIRYRAPA